MGINISFVFIRMSIECSVEPKSPAVSFQFLFIRYGSSSIEMADDHSFILESCISC